MGKPRSQSTKRKSENNVNVSMSSIKMEKRRKKTHSRTNKRIIKLYSHIRSQNQSICDSQDDSVLFVDDNHTPHKRKNPYTCSGEHNVPHKRNKSNNVNSDSSFIVINEDSNDCNPAPPENSSTPIKKTSKNLDTNLTTQASPYNNQPETKQSLNAEILDLTKEINRDSYITVDLTTESLDCSEHNRNTTVIDLDNSDQNADCTVLSESKGDISIEGDSDVTITKLSPKRREKKMHSFVKGIANLEASDKVKLLDLITSKIFNGCILNKSKSGRFYMNKPVTETQATDTMESTPVQEVVVGKPSRNSIGSNIYNPGYNRKNMTGLRMVIIDGSNVAMEHGRGKVFSVKGLKICIDYFLKRGHVVKAFVPRFRCKLGKSTDPRLLDELERTGLVVYTPSREIQGKLVTSYDDRYIIQCAAEFDGVIVSGDNYRDLLKENPRWRFAIENRVLPFTWVNDMIMFPKDPLGRQGPSLEDFLRHPPTPEVIVNKKPDV